MQDKLGTGFELSPLQERLYAVSQGSAAFQCQSAVLIEGDLDVTGMTAAIHRTVARYEILRTNFRLLAGRRRLLQVVQPTLQKSVEVVDLSQEEPELQPIRTAQIMRGMREQSLDLDSDSLARFQLLALGENRHLLVLTLPSLCADAQALTNLTEEILLAYQGSPEIESEPLQYADFSAWQRDLQESEETEAQEGRAYWRQQEAAAHPLSELPYERCRLAATFAPEAVPIGLSREFSESVATLCNTGRAAPEDFLLACWLSLFFRLTHQEEGMVGRSFDGRTYEELVPALGLFAKMLPIPWNVRGEMTFEQALLQIVETTEGAESRQDYSLSPNAADASATDETRQALLNFTWEARLSRRTIEDTHFSLYHQRCCIARFGLNLVCGFADGEIVAEIQYDAGRFQEEDVLRLAEQF
ncbi:MAG: amino acid adenylation domain protein, partial [Chthonomonadales bacterium]|nr:amino acid adenylation domain protein [Chthonomonadales bacterium]